MDPFNSRFILQEKRWLWIDYDKGISIILVGYAHCFFTLAGYGPNLDSYPIINNIDVFLYGFRMPLFFIISGLLVTRSLHKKGLKNYIGDRSNNILYPLFTWGCIEITLRIINAKFSHAAHPDPVSAFDYLNLIINPRVTGHFWYLNALFCIGVLYTFLKSKLKLTTVMQVALGLIFFCASGYIHMHNLEAGFVTDIFEYYFFFALGDLISKIMLNEVNIQRYTSWKVFLPLFTAFLAVQYVCMVINLKPTHEGISFVEHKMPYLFLVQALIGCAVSVSFSFLLQKYKMLTFLRIVGFHSLYIYCMQIIVMTVARVIFFTMLKITYVPVLFPLVWACGVILPIFIYNFCLRYNFWWLYTFKKPQKQVEYLQQHNIFSLKSAVINN